MALELIERIGPGRQAWLDAWHRTGRVPFAHPDFAAAHATPDDCVVAVVTRQDNFELLLPLIIRPLPATSVTGSFVRDGVTPYGYGGPYVSGDISGNAWQSIWRDTLAWMQGAGIITVFASLPLDCSSPSVAGTFHSGTYEIVRLADNVAVDTARAPGEQWAHYEHKVRKNVRKAERAGYTCAILPTYTDIDEFVAVYHETMQRRGASRRYYFPRSYFAEIGNGLPSYSKCVAEVRDEEGRLASVELLLRSETALYSFLGGTIAQALTYGANDLLKASVIEYAHEQGIRHYVLGGGHVDGDGIFRYKRSFDRDGIIPFRAARLIAHTSVYAQINASVGMDSDGTTYFPAYRAQRLADSAAGQSE